MNRCMFLTVALVFCALQGGATGAVISRDWKTPGDGLLTYDDVNQREWLDLTESRLAMFPGTTFEQRYQSALLELQPGGVFEGFAVASRADLIPFAESAGINTATDNFVVNGGPVDALIHLVGISYGPSINDGLASFGLLDQLSEPP